MNKPNQYFGDLNTLFRKLKDSEQIGIQSRKKEQLRSLLEEKVTGTAHKPAIEETSPVNFWNKWKYQMVGIPAFLLTLFVVAFAAQNWNIPLPSEDFSPTTPTETVEENTQQEDPEIDESLLVTDKPTIVDIEKEVEENRQLSNKPKEKPPLLVLDVNTMQEVKPDPPQDSKTIQPTTTTQPVITQTTQDETTKKDPTPAKVSENPKIVTTTPKSKEKTEIPQNDPKQETSKADKEQEKTERKDPDDTKVADNTQKDTTSQEKATDSKEPAKGNEGKTKDAELTAGDISSEVSKNIKSPNIVQKKTIESEFKTIDTEFMKIEENGFTTYFYRDPELTIDPDFSKEMLNVITKSKDPEYVTVLYVSEEKVVIEVSGEIPEWYVFVKVNDMWTIQKYEKITDVLKYVHEQSKTDTCCD